MKTRYMSSFTQQRQIAQTTIKELDNNQLRNVIHVGMFPNAKLLKLIFKYKIDRYYDKLEEAFELKSYSDQLA